jgi:hypothetical protein
MRVMPSFNPIAELKSGDAINCRWRHGRAMKHFPPTTLIRLYELLKNNSHSCEPLTPAISNGSRQRAQETLQRALQWWRMTGSNRRPPACKAGALPAELIPQVNT